MSIRILYFASLREHLGKSEETLELPNTVNNVGTLKNWLIKEGRGGLGHLPNLHCAVNQDMARKETPVHDGDEIAFFPPVTGG